MTHSLVHLPEASVEEFDGGWIAGSFDMLLSGVAASVHDTEPSLRDLFQDETLHQLMRRDQVGHEDLIVLIRQTRDRLGL